MRSTFILAAAAAATVAMPVSAATVMTTPGSAASFAPPAGTGTVINFNSGTVSAPFTYTQTGTGGIVGGTVPNTYAQPAFSDGSLYLAVQAGGTATLQSALAFQSVSFFIGSIDDFNEVSLLNAAGGIIQTFKGSSFIVPANGDQSLPATNRRVTLTVGASEQPIAGISFKTPVNALEVDNVVFAVPEPTTWALMLLGFGMVGAATRYRRRKIAVAFA